jgi:hypothetical protein
MARHTIGNKRGSVRGAPPDVYVPFGSFTDEDDAEPWIEALSLCKRMAFIAIGWVILVFFFWIAVAFGIIPKEIADHL